MQLTSLPQAPGKESFATCVKNLANVDSLQNLTNAGAGSIKGDVKKTILPSALWGERLLTSSPWVWLSSLFRSVIGHTGVFGVGRTE